MTEAIKTIPYGVSDFANLRNGNGYYVDRTSLIPNLEELHYQLFLRPRRFGKSLLLSMLGYYYDINAQDRFDTLFAGTWIHDHPTDRRGQYLVLHLDFSKIEGEDVPQIQQSFNRICKTALNAFVLYYKAFIPPDFIQELPKIATFSEAFDILTTPGNGLEHKIYILIDEYDNFSNRLLAQAGEEAYRSLCHGMGFFKSFFALLKAQNSAVSDILLTGVSPMTLDDVTSGFNIAENISQDPPLATLCGFTHADVRKAMEYYAGNGAFRPDREEAFRMVTDWYDHFRFSLDTEEQVINPTLFLGFLRGCKTTGRLPRQMDDSNVRTDYYKLRHLVTTNGRLNGKFQALETLVADNEAATDLVKTFQAETLTRPENFLSLLYYYGMVTIGGYSLGKTRLVIPNLVMRQMVADFIRSGYEDACQVNPRTMELAERLDALARTGAWRPAVELAATQVRDAMTARDLLDGEKAVQAALAAFLSCGRSFLVRTEHRAGCGFADLTLQPDLPHFAELQHAAIIEVKYVRKGEKVTTTARRRMLAEARAQLEEYAAAHNLQEEWGLAPTGRVTLVRLCLVFHGEKMLFAEEI